MIARAALIAVLVGLSALKWQHTGSVGVVAMAGAGIECVLAFLLFIPGAVELTSLLTLGGYGGVGVIRAWERIRSGGNASCNCLGGLTDVPGAELVVIGMIMALAWRVFQRSSAGIASTHQNRS